VQLTPFARVLVVVALVAVAVVSLLLPGPFDIVAAVAAIALVVLFVAGFGIPRR